MKRFKNKRNKIKKINIISISIITIIILSISMFIYITNNITSKIYDIVSKKLVYDNNNFIQDIEINEISNHKLDNLINLVKDKNDNIISIDYNMELSYKILSKVADTLKKYINNNLENNLPYYKENIKNGIILYLPIGIYSNNYYLNNLGPIIPIKINYLSSLIVNLRTKVNNYGINNVLVEIYLDITTVQDIFIPIINDTIKNNYTILLSSKIIMGNVPSFYGGVLENNSPILNN